MFEIEYKGGNAVTITTKKTALVVDPKLSDLGLKNVSVEKTIQLATEPRFLVEGGLLRIEGPGEYEAGDFSIKGLSASRHIDTDQQEKVGTIYRIDTNDVRLAVIGNIAPKLSEEQLEEIGVIDILIIPVGGGGFTLDATSAAAFVRQLEPKAVIPIHFADAAIKYEVPQDTVEVFIKELGAPTEEVGAKYKLKGSASLPAALTTVLLQRS